MNTYYMLGSVMDLCGEYTLCMCVSPLPPTHISKGLGSLRRKALFPWANPHPTPPRPLLVAQELEKLSG